ncbi:MAG: CYTH domain-containing protein [Proteobacteria bacterium]|nr:CYTH domain-containing protein [Pseudomonadota bacterium]
MATEIERKYLTVNDDWRENADARIRIIQAYMTSNDKSSIRIRIQGEQANLNIKSKTLGIERSEYEYAIPLTEAKEMLENLCDRPFIEKTRYHVIHSNNEWEIDVFAGDNEGLIVAELELNSADEAFALPDWTGKEVSDDPRYYNICLVTHPYKNW